MIKLDIWKVSTWPSHHPTTAAVAFVAATTLISYLAYSRYVLEQTRRAFKLRHDCQPISAVLLDRGPFGLRSLFRAIKLKKERKILEFLNDRHAELGKTYVSNGLFKTVYFTNDPENIKCALATHFEDWGVQKIRQAVFRDFLGSGIFTTDGTFWQHSRAMLRPQFEKSQVSAVDHFEPYVQKLFARIPEDGSTVDLQELFFKLTMDASTEFLLGAGTDCLGGDKEGQMFAETFDKCLKAGIWKDIFGYLYYLIPHREASKAIKYSHNAVNAWVQQAMLHKGSSAAKDLGERYIFVNELAKHAEVDATRIRDETLNILLAGRDTTASLLGSLWFNLARDPELYQKLRAEVAPLNGEPPSYETLKDMKLVKYTIQETLRLYPPVPILGKLALRDTLLPHGGGPTGSSPLFIPRDSILSYNTYSLMRSPALYGPDAHVFRPERWGEPEPALRPGWGYLPFGGGPRSCLGQQYAFGLAGYVVVRLVQRYGWVEGRGEKEWREGLAVTCCSGDGALVGVGR